MLYTLSFIYYCLFSSFVIVSGCQIHHRVNRLYKWGWPGSKKVMPYFGLKQGGWADIQAINTVYY